MYAVQGRTNLASSTFRVGEFWIEDSNLGMQTNSNTFILLELVSALGW